MLTLLLVWCALAIAAALYVGPVRAARLCRAPITDVVAWIPGQDDGVPQDGNLQLIGALTNITGSHFGFKRGDYVGMDIPADNRVEAKFWLLPHRQSIWFMGSATEPDKVWVYRFPNDAVFTVHRPSGDYYGIHPCEDYVITRQQAEAIYRMVR